MSLTERSINSLQWFYTIILSLAIVKVITQIITVESGIFSFEKELLLNFIVFMLLAIPFHQGANQYLNKAYLSGKAQAKRWTGLVDFVFFFIEGLVFYAMAITLTNNKYFYFAALLLLIIDVIWLLTVLITDKKLFIEVYKWLIINASAIILVIPFSIWKWENEENIYLSIAIILIMRTFADYIWTSTFYWPSFESKPKS